MKMPFRWARKPDIAGKVPTATSDPVLAAPQPPRVHIALLVASSALLSGIALVVWNRRSLERIREAAATNPATPSESREFI